MDFSNIRSNAKRLKITDIPIDRIKFFKVRTRDEAAFSDLRKSISESGLKYPIGVRKLKKNKLSNMEYDYECIKGHGRTMACSSLGWDTIPAIVYNVNDPETVLLYILENENRQKLPSVDIARLMKIESDQGLSSEEIARKFHLAPSTVRQYVSFVKSATTDTIKMIKKETITFEDGLKLSTLSKPEQKEAASAISSAADTKKEAKVIINNVRHIKKSSPTNVTQSKVRNVLSQLRLDIKTKQKYFNELSGYWRDSYCALRDLLQDEKIRKLLDAEKIDYQIVLNKEKSVAK